MRPLRLLEGLRGGTSGAVPGYFDLIRDEFRQRLRADIRVTPSISAPMLEVRSLAGERSVYFHPPTATVLVYDAPQDDETLVEAHEILEREPTSISVLTDHQRIGSIEYYATGACNLRCGYCYLGPLADEPRPFDLAPDGFVSRLERLLIDDRIAPRLKVAIIGGEPLLAFDGLRRAVERVDALARAHGVDVSFGITTNGHLVDETVSAFLRAHAFAIKISYDGRYDERNRLGKGAAGREALDLVRLRHLTEGMPVTLNATLLPAQFESQREVFGELADAGFSRVQVSVANGFSWGPSDLQRFFRGLCGLTWETQRRGCLESQQAQVIATLEDYKLRRSHCGAGISHVAIDAEGHLESCSTSFNHDGHGRQSTYGMFDVDDDPACGPCAFRYGCGGGCRAFRRDGQPDITDCAPIYLRFLMALGLVAELPGFLADLSSSAPRTAGAAH